MASYVVTWTDADTRIRHHTLIDPAARAVNIAALVAAAELGDAGASERVILDDLEVDNT